MILYKMIALFWRNLLNNKNKKRPKNANFELKNRNQYLRTESGSSN